LPVCQVTRRGAHHATRKAGGRRCGFARLLHYDSAWFADPMLIRRIADRWLLRVIMGWLTVPVMEWVGLRVIVQQRPGRRGEGRTRFGDKPDAGGSLLPALLLAWRNHGHQHQLNAHVVNYADDFVICCRPGDAERAKTQMKALMMRLKLEVNETRTRVACITEDNITFRLYARPVLRKRRTTLDWNASFQENREEPA
jgi:hypothetical protein